jgi:hypothetical protein
VSAYRRRGVSAYRGPAPFVSDFALYGCKSLSFSIVSAVSPLRPYAPTPYASTPLRLYADTPHADTILLAPGRGTN